MAEKVPVIAKCNVYIPSVGETKSKGDRFQMDAYESERFLRDNLVMKLEGEEAVLDSGEPVDISTKTLEELLDLWELEAAPSEYLAEFPDGPHAALARQIVELMG